ncbi:MAG: thioredoxin family protein [Bacteroidetes bacterium]|nr:thioredoxin family protein [Bacteroidota bacterium]
MKRVALILLVSLLCSSFSQAEELIWYDWNEAQVLAKAQEKSLMVFVYASWCHLCKRMDTKVFANDEVVTMLNENFIPVKLDAEFTGELQRDGNTYSTMELLAELTDNQFRGIPAYVFVQEKSGKKCKLEAGLKDPQEMKALLKKYE